MGLGTLVFDLKCTKWPHPHKAGVERGREGDEGLCLDQGVWDCPHTTSNRCTFSWPKELGPQNWYHGKRLSGLQRVNYPKRVKWSAKG